MKHSTFNLLYGACALALACILFLGAAAPPPLLRNFVTTNTALTIAFDDAGANVLWGWDDTDNAAGRINIGAGLAYTHATHTLSASGGVGSIITNGYTTNVPPQAIDNQFSPVLNLTYGQYSNSIITRSNITLTSSPFTNENRGTGSLLMGHSVTNSTNQITGTAQAALLVGQVGSANGANRITGAGASALIAGVASGAATNEITSSGGASLLVGAPFVGGINSIRVAAGSSALLVGESLVGGVNEMTGSGILLGRTSGGTNRITGLASLLFGTASTDGINDMSGQSAFAAVVALPGGRNFISGTPSFMSASASLSTNRASGNGSYLVGAATDTNTLTASGSPSFLFAFANRTFGSAAATAINSFFIGSGFTNSVSNSFMVAYGQSNQLHHTKDGLALNSDAPRSLLDVNGATTHGASVTNLDLLASQFMATDANKREVSTLDLSLGTNINTGQINSFTNIVDTLIAQSSSSGFQYYFSGTNNAISGYKNMYRSDIVLSTGNHTNNVTVITNNQYVYTFISSAALGVSQLNQGGVILHFHAWRTSAGTLNLQPELYIRRGTVETEIVTGDPVLLNTTDGQEYTTLMNITTNVTDTLTNFLIVKFKAVSTSGTPNCAFVTEGNTAAGVSIPVPAASFVLKSGDTMTGNLTVPGLTNTSLNASQYVATDSGKKSVSTLNGNAWTNVQTTNIVVNIKAPFATNFVATLSGLHLFCTGTNQLITLPNATNSPPGMVIPIHVSSTTANVLVTNANGVQLIGGALSFAVGAECAVSLYNDGSNWHP